MSRILISSLKLSYVKLSYASVLSQNATFLKSTLPCANCSIAKRKYGRPAVAERTFDNVDARINKLDQTVKRLGRTTLREVEGTLKEIKTAGSISVTQSLMMIRSCGSLLVEVKPGARTELAHKIWNLLEDLGVKLDISHYNALLRVYLENDYSFTPSDILSDIEKIGLEPNRVTCQRLINRYCQMGDIAGATRILQFMREKGMPINESVFNALINGHSKVNDMENAAGIITVMREGGIEPSSETFTLLMCGYIKNGNLAKVEELFKQCESMEIMLTDKDYFDIIYAYTMHGYEDEVDKIISKIRKSATYNHDAMNFAFKLLTADKPEIAYKILRSMQRATRPDGSILPLGNFFIAHLIRNDYPTDLVIKYCRDLMNENLNPGALSIALENAVRYGKEDAALSLFREAKRDDLLPIRQHYFWPLLVKRGRRNDINGICDILHKMNREFGLLLSSETLREYVIPCMLKIEPDISKILLDLKSCGVSTSHAAGNLVHYLVERGEMKKAAEVADEFVTYYAARPFRGALTASFLKTLDIESFVSLIRDFSSHLHWIQSRETESEAEITKVDHREFMGETLEFIVEKLLSNGQKSKLGNLLRKITEAEIGISEGRIEAIKALIKDEVPSDVISSFEKLSSEELATPTIKSKTPKFSVASMDHTALERLYESAKEKGTQPGVLVRRMLFTSYAKNHNLEKMNQIKQELEAEGFIPNTTMLVFELDAYVANGKLEEAVQLYQKLCDSEPNFVLNPVKTLNLVALLVEHEQFDQALEVLNQRIDQKIVTEEVLRDNSSLRINVAQKILNTLANRGLVDKVKEFCNLMFTNKFIEPSAYLLGPLIRAHIKNDDYEGAMKEFEHCVHTYKATPLKNELALYFIEKEDTANLQKVTDLSTQVHGEMNSLLDLMFVFLESGRIKQAKKILETPGLRLRADRLEFMAISLMGKGCADHMINLLKVTKGIPFIDRSSIYEKLLSMYVEKNDPQSSLSLWMEIQEEDLQPTDSFLIALSNLLEANNMVVPFVVPDKTKITKEHGDARGSAGGRKTRVSRVSSDLNLKLKKLIESGDLDGALTLTKSAGFIRKQDCTKLVESLLQSNRYAEAKECFSNFFKKYNSVIYRPTFTLLLKHAAENADMEFFAELERSLKEEFRRKIVFDSWWATAYQKAGRVEEYISSWEDGLTKIKTKEELSKFLFRYPRTSIMNIMNENPEYIPRVEAFARKCHDIDSKQGTVPSVLFNYYMIRKDYEKAEEIWENYLKKADRILFQSTLKYMKNNLDTELGSKLHSYFKDLAHVKPTYFAIISSALINVHVERNEIEKAKEYLEETLAKVSIETLNTKVLESLKSACLDKGIAFSYDLPEKNQQYDKEESSDSESD